MKYTIIALLFIGTAYGQTTNETVVPIWVIDSMGQHSVKTPKPPKSIYRQIADAYDEYVASLREEFERERSNVLSKLKFAKSIEIRNPHKDTIEVSYRAWGFEYCEVIIRQRPTLEGFMEYLRSK